MTIATIILDCASLDEMDLGTIDWLAGDCLAAKRSGLDVQLENAGATLRGLIELCGLAGVLGVEAGRQAEQREEPGCVEEEGQLADPAF
jgi:hypothetical protein